MRCIMEMIDINGSVVDGSRQVVPVTNGKATFTIDKSKASDGKCLFWADYVTDEQNDKFYKTSGNNNLTNIDYASNQSNDIYNNAAMDAFCAAADVQNINNSTITLKRPFVRLAIKKDDLNTMLDGATGLTADFNVGSGFSVASGETTVTKNLKTAEDTPLAINADDEYPFFFFIFPSNEQVTTASTISLAKESIEKTITIAAKDLAEAAKTPNKSFNLTPVNENETKVTIEVDGSWTDGSVTPTPEQKPDAENLKIGDYISAEGTITTDASKAIAIVFKIGKSNNDASKYDNQNNVVGYAMALKNVNRAKVPDETNPMPTLTPTENADADYSGYTLTTTLLTAFKDYTSPLLTTNWGNFQEGNEITATNLSSWYIPSFAQLTEITQMALGTSSNEAFKKAIEATKAQFTTAKWNFLSSTASSDKKILGVQLNTASIESEKLEPDLDKAQCAIRPVLTIFAAATN